VIHLFTTATDLTVKDVAARRFPMLTYARVKTIGVQKQGENRRVVSGVLEDELYAMQCEIVVSWPDPAIEAVLGTYRVHR